MTDKTAAAAKRVLLSDMSHSKIAAYTGIDSGTIRKARIRGVNVEKMQYGVVVKVAGIADKVRL